MKTRSCLGSVARLALLAFAIVPALLAGDADTRSPQVTGTLEAMIPGPLKPLLMENPTVRFLITVDEEGKLVDHLAIEATHHELLPRAEVVLQQAAFEPALAQGKPVQASGQVMVFFYDPEQRAYLQGLAPMPFGSTPNESASRRIYVLDPARYAYRRSEPAELDRPPEVRATKIMVLTDANGQPAAGECLVEFFIDAAGEVRLPRIVSSDNETVSLSALLTLRQTRFNPIIRDGMPTYVKVRQPMSFATKPSDPPAAK